MKPFGRKSDVLWKIQNVLLLYDKDVALVGSRSRSQCKIQYSFLLFVSVLPTIYNFIMKKKMKKKRGLPKQQQGKLCDIFVDLSDKRQREIFTTCIFFSFLQRSFCFYMLMPWNVDPHFFLVRFLFRSPSRALHRDEIFKFGKSFHSETISSHGGSHGIGSLRCSAQEQSSLILLALIIVKQFFLSHKVIKSIFKFFYIQISWRCKTDKIRNIEQ